MSRALKFLHLTTFYPPYSFGGDAMYLYRLSHALGDAGHEVDVIHCVDAYHLLHPSPPEIGFTAHPRVQTHQLRSGWGWLSPLLTHQTGRPWLKGRQIRRVLTRTRYDVVHFHNVSLLGAGILTWSAHQPGAITMYTTHEHWLICPTHVLWKFERRPCEKPQCVRCTLSARRPPQWWRYTGLLGRAGRHVDQFVAPSRFTARMHAERGFPQPVAHLPYFIDRVDDDWKDPSPRPHANPYFLFVGRLEAIKGVQTLIDVWPRVAEADLLIAGTGTYEPTLRALANDHPRIKFLGARSQRDLGPLYRHALACVVPSLTFETFGIVILEAFARKTPAIVRNLGALPEVVEESGGGLVYGNEQELLDAIRRLATSPALRCELGTKGYDTFVERWSREAHLRLYFDFLRRTALRKFGRVPWEDDVARPASSCRSAVEPAR